MKTSPTRRLNAKTLLSAFFLAMACLLVINQPTSGQTRRIRQKNVSKTEWTPVVWGGEYSVGGFCGRTAGGTGIVVDTSINVTRAEPDYSVYIESNGYQRSDQIEAKGVADGDKLRIYFVRYSEERDFSYYKPNQLLVTLERRGKSFFIREGAYQPGCETGPKLQRLTVTRGNR